MLHLKNAFLVALICILTVFSCSTKSRNNGNSEKLLSSYLDSIAQSHSSFYLSSATSMQTLDLYNGSQENNATVGGYQWNGGPNQMWQLEKAEKGYIIRSSFSHKVLTADTENSKLVQKDFNGNDNQLWILSGSVDSVSIINKAFNKNLLLQYDKVVFDSHPQEATKYWHIKTLQKLQKEFVSCNCNENLQFIRHLVETSYSGFQDKVNAETADDYKRLYQLTLEEAEKTNDPAKCYKIIRDYLLFFHDNHLQFLMNGMPLISKEKVDAEKIRKDYAHSESVKTSEKKIKDYLDANRKSISELEGIWESMEGDYRCAIIPDSLNKNRYLGIILKGDSIYWMPGQVKMDFRKQADNRYLLYYGMQNHSIIEGWNTEISGDTLFTQVGKWIKKYPKNGRTGSGKRIIPQQNAAWFELKNVDDSTLLLSLPNFDPNNKPLVDNLIDSNADKLQHCPYLIIDIRGNGGGLDKTFDKIMPFIFTNSFEMDGNDILSSQENIACMEKQLFYSQNNNEKEWIGSIVQRMKENPGKFVPFVTGGTYRVNTGMTYPRKIGILINGGCASSAEQFLLFGKESKKVTLFGQPTSGTLDYSNVRPVEKCPSPCFNLKYPMTRSKRLPDHSIDKEKIKPDVYLTNDQNWVEVAVRQLKSKQ